MSKRRQKRPTRLTPQLIDAICEQVAAGVSDAETERLLGLSVGAINRWRRRGTEQPQSRYAAFAANHSAAWTAARLGKLAQSHPNRVPLLRAMLLPAGVSDNAAEYLRDLLEPL